MYAGTTVEEISNDLICVCGCNMVLNTCQNQTANKMRAEIKTLIDQGKDKAEILDWFVDKYGATVLAAPPKTGFNLTAWITPFLTIGVAGGLLFAAVKKWSGRNHQNHTLVPVEIKSEYATKLKNELDNFEEGEYS